MTDDEFRTILAAANTYKEAAAALELPYSAVYDRSRKLGVFPKRVAEKRARRAAAPQAPRPPSTSSFALREPVSEQTLPILSAWRSAEGIAVRDGVVRVRLDQSGRVRAEVHDDGNDWASWTIRDAAGHTVGKIGLRGGLYPGQAIRECEDGADEDLVSRRWLHPGQRVPLMLPCDTAAATCSPDGPRITPDMIGALCVVFLAGSDIAIPAGWSEEQFVKLARWCFQRETKAREAESAA